MKKPRLTPNEIGRVVSYDPATGILTWAIRPAVNVRVGDEAGSVDGDGYKHFKYLGTIYPVHHVVWAILYGEWPDRRIDHRDGDGLNNRPYNLRLATNSQNCANRKIPTTNTSGAKGVRIQPNGKFRATIGFTLDGGRKSKSLGCFDTIEQASDAYMAAAVSLFGQFARVA